MFETLTRYLTAAAAIVLFAGAASAQVTIQGAGASFPNPLYQKWVAAYNKANPEVKVDYQSVGSGAGIKQISAKKVQFAGSDAPMTADQEKEAGAKLLHLPTVAGPVVMIYNLPSVTSELKLDGEVVAGIFLGEIKTWDDAKIKALNPGLELPATAIASAHRADGSGTTFIFTSYLASASKTWADKVGAGTSVSWPVGTAAPKNDGVAAAVKNTVGGIGYVEYAYAANAKLPYATQINKDGKAVPASIASVEAAASGAEFPADMKVSIVNAAGEKAYPIAGYTYLLVYQDLSYMKDKNLAEQVVKFIDWCETDGQAMANSLGYAALPKAVQAKVHEQLKTITFDGQPLLK